MIRAPLASLSRHARAGQRFLRFAKWTSTVTGHPAAFIAACLLIAAWLVSGPLFGFSDTWQLVINTSTTIVTFLMVFLIQNTQNRDAQAVQIKLDELLRTTKGHNALMDLEELTEQELNTLKERYRELAQEARKNLRKGKTDTGSPEIWRKRWTEIK